jgi:hypothetical protein
MAKALVICCNDLIRQVVWRFSYLATEGHEQEELERIQDKVFCQPPEEVVPIVLGYGGDPLRCDFLNGRQQRCPGEFIHDKATQSITARFFEHYWRSEALNMVYGPRKKNKSPEPDMFHPVPVKRLQDAFDYAESKDICIACPEEPNPGMIYPVTFNLYPAAFVR